MPVSNSSRFPKKTEQQLFVLFSVIMILAIAGILSVILLKGIQMPGNSIVAGNLALGGSGLTPPGGSFCVDSDNGQNYFIAGTVHDSSQPPGIFPDSCAGTSIPNLDVIENYCNPLTGESSQQVSCSSTGTSNFCDSGQCLFCNHNSICEPILRETFYGCADDCLSSQEDIISLNDSTHDLIFTRWVNSGWNSSVIDTGFYGWSGLAKDPAGNLYVSYTKNIGTSSHLFLASKISGGAWNLEDTGFPSLNNSVAFSSADSKPYIFGISNNGIFLYYKNSAGNWISEKVESSVSNEYYSDIAIAADGKIHVVYRFDRSGLPHLGYAVRDLSGNWTKEDLGQESFKELHLALDSSNNPHLSFYNRAVYKTFGTYAGIYHAAKLNGAWTYDLIDHYGTETNDIAVSSLGKIYISYYYNNSTNQGLSLATYDGSWKTEKVEWNANSGQYNSIVIDPGTQSPVISYFDSTNRALKVAYLSPLGWITQSVPTPPHDGKYTSIVNLPISGSCGDGVCSSSNNEHNNTCPGDCFCGDTICDSTESASSCFADCSCGNGVCDISNNETATSCSGDCSCGDGVCDASEKGGICGQDCAETVGIGYEAFNKGTSMYDVKFAERTQGNWNISTVKSIPTITPTVNFSYFDAPYFGIEESGSPSHTLTVQKRDTSGNWQQIFNVGPVVSGFKGITFNYFDSSNGFYLAYKDNSLNPVQNVVLSDDGINYTVTGLSANGYGESILDMSPNKYNGDIGLLYRVPSGSGAGIFYIYSSDKGASFRGYELISNPSPGAASLAFDGTENAIAAYKSSNTDLTFNQRMNGSWTPITIATGTGGGGAEIAYRAGTIGIVYTDLTKKELSYASSTDGGNTWGTETVLTGFTGLTYSLSFSDYGNPIIAINDSRNFALSLAFAEKVNGSWQIQTLDNSGSLASSISIESYRP